MLCFPVVYSFSQFQKLKGEVLHSSTKAFIQEVTVRLMFNDSIAKQTISNEQGEFSFDSVLIGTYDLYFCKDHYASFVFPDVTLLASRVEVVSVLMQENVNQLDDITIVPKKDRSRLNNDMVTNSGKTIYMQEMRKLAGSLDDPIRVAGMMPGVTSDAAFSENFVSIRGNSPRGLKYMFEGIELPNPTHFARIGSSGGTFTVFSMQLMDKTDFFLGAFPAEYSNALSGVMDVKLRSGYNLKNEYSITLGTLGIDLTAEGPFNAKKKSSFLFNYRYSVVGLARLIGYPTQPTYQDLSFVMNFPQKSGNFKLIGVAGTSDRKRIPVLDSNVWEGSVDRLNLSLRSDVFSLGGVYEKRIKYKSNLKISSLLNATRQIDNKGFIEDDYSETLRRKNEYTSLPQSIAISLKHHFNGMHQLKIGASSTYTVHDWEVLGYDFERDKVDTTMQGKGNSLRLKSFVQSRHYLTDRIILNTGVSLLNYSVNQNLSLEPRAGLNYLLKKKGNISLALGRHSQIENFAIYQYNHTDSIGKVSHPNKNLDFIKANHLVLGYRTTAFKNHYLNIEGYYQMLDDVPVSESGTFSMLNIAELEELRPLTNEGAGTNYGIDFGIERYGNKGLYYMINASWFRSFYTAADGVERSTEFDQRFNFKFLAGKEYVVGVKKGKRNLLGWNTNLAYVGGRPYTPLDFDNSREYQETIYDESLAFSLREDNLLFADVTFTYKVNKKNRTGIWSLQIKNIYSNGNAIYREYDTVLDQEVTIPSSSFFPNLSYRLEF